MYIQQVKFRTCIHAKRKRKQKRVPCWAIMGHWWRLLVSNTHLEFTKIRLFHFSDATKSETKDGHFWQLGTKTNRWSYGCLARRKCILSYVEAPFRWLVMITVYVHVIFLNANWSERQDFSKSLCTHALIAVAVLFWWRDRDSWECSLRSEPGYEI